MPIAIITGASEGLGRALTLGLAEDGWDVIVDGRRREPLEAAADAARAAGATVIAIAGDIDDASHRRALADAARRIGRLDLVVANAGTLGPAPLPSLATVGLDALAETLRTNVVAQVGLVQEVLPLLVACRGTYVAVTSDAAVEAYEGWGAYGASKAALEQVANVLAAEQPDIRVYRFDPGDMRTRMHQDAFPGEDISDRPLPETVVGPFRSLLATSPPNGRYRASDLVALSSAR